MRIFDLHDAFSRFSTARFFLGDMPSENFRPSVHPFLPDCVLGEEAGALFMAIDSCLCWLTDDVGTSSDSNQGILVVMQFHSSH